MFGRNKTMDQSSLVVKDYSFTGKVYSFFGLGILVSAIVALCAPIAFQAFGWLTLSESHQVISFNGSDAMYYFLIGVSIALFIEVIIISVVGNRMRSLWALLPYLLYCVTMGLLLSFFCMIIDWYTIGLAFGITSLCFVTIGALSYFSKGSLSTWVSIAIGMLLGAIILSVVNIFLRSSWIYWLISFGLLFIMLIFTAVDFRNVNIYQEQGATSNGLAVFCAFNLYYDFVYIFIRVLEIVAYIKGNN